jgi:DNA-binding transcriptional ArsR family regulator
MQRKGLAAEDRLGAVPLFAALGDPVRLAMIARLCDSGPLPTIELKQGVGVSRQAITKHLQVLESAGLVRSERVGRDRQWHASQAACRGAPLSRSDLKAVGSAVGEAEGVCRGGSGSHGLTSKFCCTKVARSWRRWRVPLRATGLA